jgi:probable rRNA maturation factor
MLMKSTMKKGRKIKMAKLKAYIRNNQNKIKIPVGIRLLIRRCCQAVLTTEKFEKDTEVSVTFVSNNEIKNLNKTYRNKDSVTDVLSFPLNENDNYEINAETGAVVLGDIVISLETAFKQAENFGHSLEREIGFLTVHSMLHLLGYDHETSSLDERKMREKEEEVLEILGISRDVTFVVSNND